MPSRDETKDFKAGPVRRTGRITQTDASARRPYLNSKGFHTIFPPGRAMTPSFSSPSARVRKVRINFIIPR